MRQTIEGIVVIRSLLWSVSGVEDLALILAAENGARITILSIVDDASKVDGIKADTNEFLEKAHRAGVEIDQKVVSSGAYESRALRESASADLLIVRATHP